MVARFAPVERDEEGRLALCWPGAKLLAAEPLPPSGIAFLLLALSSVSFDGLSKTFFWLGLFGVNPLEFPGRTAVIGSGTFGLVLTFVLLAAVFLFAVWLGQRLAGSGPPLGQAAGLLVWSIVPIALAYHVAHYLTALLVDGQYALPRCPTRSRWAGTCSAPPTSRSRPASSPVRSRPGGCGTSRPAPSSWAMCSPSSSRTALPGACIRSLPAPRSASFRSRC